MTATLLLLLYNAITNNNERHITNN